MHYVAYVPITIKCAFQKKKKTPVIVLTIGIQRKPISFAQPDGGCVSNSFPRLLAL